MADEPIYEATVERLYARLPDAYRVADRVNNYTLKKFLSGICTVQADVDRLVARFDRLDIIERTASSMLPFSRYQRQMFRVLRTNFMRNPTFRDSSGSAIARRNSVLNPSMRATGANTEIRRNECINPMPSSLTGWSTFAGTSDTAPWNSTRSAAKITGDGTSLAYAFSAKSARAWASGTPVVVSATVQGLTSRSCEIYVHRRSTNTYYGGLHNPTIAFVTGNSQRISTSIVLPENVPADDLDVAVLGYGAVGATTALQNGSAFWVGDALIEQGTVALPYFDGSFAGSTYVTHQWVGGTNNSVSQKMAPSIANNALYQSVAGGAVGPYQQEPGAARVTSAGTTTQLGVRAINTSYAGNRRVYVRAKARLDPGAGWNANIQFIGRDDPNNDSTLFTDPQNVSLTITDNGMWAEYSADYFVPSGRTLTSFYVVAQKAAGTLPNGVNVDFKDYSISNTPGTFFDGYTTDTESLDFLWVSTPNASESVAQGRGFGGAAVDWDTDGTAVQGPLVGGYRTADVRISTYLRSHAVENSAAGQFYSARLTLMALPGETPSGTTVNAKIYDGSGFIAEIPGGPITLPTDGSPVTVNVLATAQVSSSNAVRLYVYGSTKAFRVQKTLVAKVSAIGEVPGEYFDGDGTDYFTSVYEWEGVSNRSISTYSVRAPVSESEEATLGWTPLGQTSDLVDPHSADVEWLDWLGQLVGVDTKRLLGEQERRDAVQFASSGFHAGCQQALEDAARSELTGSRYVRVYTHSTDLNIGVGTMWDVLLVTKTSETPSPGTIVDTIIRKGAKPAGVRLYHRSYEVPWDVSDTLNWDQRDALTWAQYEEYGVG